MAESRTKPRRRWRKALLGLGVLLLVLIVLVAAAPTLVNLGLGQGAVVSALERNLNGTVSLDRLSLGWFGPQTASGLSVTGADGRTAAQIDLGINAGLLGLLTGRVETLAVDVSGLLSGELRRDGSTSFEDLFVTAEPRKGGGRKPSTKDRGRAALGGLPPTTVRIDGVSVELKEAGRDGALRLDDLAGALEYEPGGPVRLNLAGATAGGTAPGSITIAATGQDLFDDQGALTPDSAAVQVDVALGNMPVLLSQRPTELTTLHLTASSDDLAEQLVITFEADAAVDGAGAGRLEARLTLEQPVQPDGTLSLELGRIRGEVTGTDVPTALFQTVFAGTPIVVSRDIGPAIDVEARFAAAGAGDVSVTIVADAGRVDFSGIVDPQSRSIGGKVFRVTAAVHPDLVADMTNLYIDRPAGVEIDIDSFSIPPQGDEPGAQLAGIAAGGTLKLTTPVTIAQEAGGPARATVEGLDARFDTAALGEGISLEGSGTVSGTAVMFDESLSGYLADDGSFDFAGVVPLGTVSVRDMDAATLARFIPQQAELIEAALSAPISVSLTTRIESGEPIASLTAGGEGHYLGVVVARRGDTLHVANGRATLA
ncbi:MAG: AsmA family protein, partial [Planctomycetota bacterium]